MAKRPFGGDALLVMDVVVLLVVKRISEGDGGGVSQAAVGGAGAIAIMGTRPGGRGGVVGSGTAAADIRTTVGLPRRCTRVRWGILARQHGQQLYTAIWTLSLDQAYTNGCRAPRVAKATNRVSTTRRRRMETRSGYKLAQMV